MAIYEPIKLKIFVVVTKWIDELFSYFEQAHIEEELEDSVNWNVEVNFKHNPATAHMVSRGDSYDSLSSNDGEDEEYIGGQGNNLINA